MKDDEKTTLIADLLDKASPEMVVSLFNKVGKRNVSSEPCRPRGMDGWEGYTMFLVSEYDALIRHLDMWSLSGTTHEAIEKACCLLTVEVADDVNGIGILAADLGNGANIYPIVKSGCNPSVKVYNAFSSVHCNPPNNIWGDVRGHLICRLAELPGPDELQLFYNQGVNNG